ELGIEALDPVQNSKPFRGRLFQWRGIARLQRGQGRLPTGEPCRRLLPGDIRGNLAPPYLLPLLHGGEQQAIDGQRRSTAQPQACLELFRRSLPFAVGGEEGEERGTAGGIRRC